ncbi:DUF3006 domain-containing protein [Clostridium grantii]|uniref:DUF3006 domain-containing protein n=1 Tax=Clostridium grantii DSM 8605 TaxID=1121316 RepID=A0A1M5W0R9_9CLOT|nr:DUF3006 domain-containing protein [Clostridium grantii]SHH81095.1 Protein of unknown function [Clostridium grantii DSM 8605]
MKLIIDRFEGKFAICEKEDKTMIDIEKEKLPVEIKEGDVIYENKGRYIIDLKETKKRKSEIENMIKNLWE